MSEPLFRTIKTNGVRLRVAQEGTGPLVLLLHGFPESWYSWRHQLPALAAAGYCAVAPDMRGYGGSDKPMPIEAYAARELTGDVAGLIEAYGAEQAVVIGHDWGAWIAWRTALNYRDKVKGVGALSVPYTPRSPARPTDLMRKIFAEKFFYQLYFQDPGVAEAELDADIRRSLRLILYSASGEAGQNDDFMNKGPNATLLEGMADPDTLPDWLTAYDLDQYEQSFRQGGFRAPINWYRNIDRNWEHGASIKDERIHQPALFISGDRDLVLRMRPTAVDDMKALVPNLSISEILPGCGHWTQQERPEDVNRLLLLYLQELPGAT